MQLVADIRCSEPLARLQPDRMAELQCRRRADQHRRQCLKGEVASFRASSQLCEKTKAKEKVNLRVRFLHTICRNYLKTQTNRHNPSSARQPISYRCERLAPHSYNDWDMAGRRSPLRRYVAHPAGNFKGQGVAGAARRRSDIAAGLARPSIDA